MYIIYSIFLFFLVCDSVSFTLAQAVSQISSSLSPNSTASVLDPTESTTALSFAEITTQTGVASSPFIFAIPTELSEPINITGTPDPGLSSSDVSQALPSESNPRATSTTIEWITASLPPSTTTTTITFPLGGSETTTSGSGTSASASTPSSTNTVTSEVFLSTSQSTSLVSPSIMISTSTSVLPVAPSTSNSTVLTPSETGISVIPTESPLSSAELSGITPSASSSIVSSGIESLAFSTTIFTTEPSITTLLISESFTENSSTTPLPELSTFSTIVATLSTVPINPSISYSSEVPSVPPPDPSSFEPITTVPSPSSSGNSGSSSSPSASGLIGSSPSASESGNGSSPSDSVATITPQSSTIDSSTTISYQSETLTAATDTVPSAKPSDVPSIIETAASSTVISLGTSLSVIESTSSVEFSVTSSTIDSSETLSEFDVFTTSSSTVQVNTEPNPGVSHSHCHSHCSCSSKIKTANSTVKISTTTASSLTDLVPSLSPLDKTFNSDIQSFVSTSSVWNTRFFIESVPTVTTLVVSTSPKSTSPATASPPRVKSSAQSFSVSSIPVTVSFLPGDMAESKTTTYLSSIYTLIQVYTRSPTFSVVESSSSPILPN
ncbi:uncharacterized protein EAF02_004326 [Botrytis sinoallii]|uniref:uncharacterized protein n=1 Tax=Botrytis sinoallii TaxID=1463999 RepID=UPI0018FFA7F0|nr:uncharacterized protein EAF02_004326 [Botrytis sinoallii]KAF7885817.1 hypothetical protein EAF02_004326 [Botrytis sinoallii]